MDMEDDRISMLQQMEALQQQNQRLEDQLRESYKTVEESPEKGAKENQQLLLALRSSETTKAILEEELVLLRSKVLTLEMQLAKSDVMQLSVSRQLECSEEEEKNERSVLQKLPVNLSEELDDGWKVRRSQKIEKICDPVID
ncbi:unnamed protein product [Cyprideis torosa]|uniref:Uncharacterized protein n=1 Tax=Cyprideis torosa TaxID=163714 RepID=A0A7R8WCL7_9CRUS|nr:unnamed protein product [Cyprideis torosa]CAG0890983.1 unnamed protein product [Cyprideis torosa]